MRTSSRETVVQKHQSNWHVETAIVRSPTSLLNELVRFNNRSRLVERSYGLFALCFYLSILSKHLIRCIKVFFKYVELVAYRYPVLSMAGEDGTLTLPLFTEHFMIAIPLCMNNDAYDGACLVMALLDQTPMGLGAFGGSLAYGPVESRYVGYTHFLGNFLQKAWWDCVRSGSPR